MNLAPNSATTILIVDDSESDRAAYRRFLQMDENARYQILEAGSLEEGLDLWRSQQPNLALIDINLPDNSGLTFLEAFQNSDPSVKLPIIVMTGAGDERIAVQAMKLGASDYVIKEDISGSFLRRCVTNVLNQVSLTQKLARFQQQEDLLTQISLNIRKFLNQNEIYQAIVTEVREFLAVDRVIIYKFNADMSGGIVAESVIPLWSSCFHTQITDTCFQKNLGGAYNQGKIFVADDIYAAHLTDCHVQLLEQFQIRANLVVPILLPTEQEQDFLWGLLAFHQCSGPRHWDEADLRLIDRLSVQLAIAIQQANWYWELKTLNQSLEQKVEERTAELQALLTQHEQTEQELVQQTTLLRETQEFARLGSWYLDVKTEMVQFSPEVLNLFGLDASQANQTHTTMMDFIAPSDRDRRHQVIRQSLETRTPYESDFQIIRTDGSTGYIFSKGKPIIDASGQVTGLTGILMDISDRKQAETAVKQLQDRLERILRGSNDGWWDWDMVTDELYLSPSWWRMIGYEAGELESTFAVWQSLIHPEDRERLIARLDTIFANPNIISDEVEFRMCHKQGHYVPILSRGRLERDVNGRPIRSSGTNIDLTLLKQKEQELQAAVDRLSLLNNQLEDRVYQRTEELERSQYLVERILNTSPNLIYLEDLQLERLIFVNQTVFSLLGYSPDELLAMETAFLSQLIHPDDLDRVLEVGRREREEEIRDDEIIEIEYRIRDKAGHWRWFVSKETVFSRDAQGKVKEIIGNAQDISDRKQTELALQESEAKFRILTENIHGVIYRYVLHPDGTDQFIYVNPYIKTIYGVTVEAALEDSSVLFSKVHADDLQTLRNMVSSSAQTLNPFYSEHRITTSDGILKWLQVTAIPEQQTNGDILWQGIILDISDRKQAERALRESQQFIQTIIDTVPLPLFWKNRESVFLGCNHQLASVLGLNSSEEIIGKTDFDLSPTQEQAQLYRISDQRVMNSGIAEQGIEETQTLENGDLIWIEAHKAPLRDGDNQVIGIVGMFQDITDRKHYELQLQQKNQELQALLQLREEALTLREDMSNMIVHDLRNPLATMILAANMMRKYINRPDSQPLILKKTDQILDSGKQLQNMIDSLLFMAKLESGTLLFNPTETDLHQLGSAVLADFDLVASASQINLLSELPPPGKSIWVDTTILRRIIDNLMSNAFKFSPAGGSVSLSLEYLSDNRVKVKVADTGAGISEAEKQKIFNKFEIGSLKPGVHQTGLGLAFCKIAVEAHQGTLAIEPNHPQGSIFIVEI
ncbi:MAG: PAS domain S-box protein [Snowella sp.]|nr:PAS domain S-box protein [Snowella sp.]